MAQYVVKLAHDGVILNSEKTAITKVNVTIDQNSGTLESPTLAPAPALPSNVFDIQLFPQDSENQTTITESKNIGTYTINFSKPIIPGKTTMMVSIKKDSIPSSKLYIDFKTVVNSKGQTTIDLPPVTKAEPYLFNINKINGHDFSFKENKEVNIHPAPTVADSSISATLIDSEKPYLTAVLWPDSTANIAVELNLNSAPDTPISGNFEIAISENAPVTTAPTKTN